GTDTAGQLKGQADQAKEQADQAKGQAGGGKGGGKASSKCEGGKPGKDGDPDCDGGRLTAREAKPNEVMDDEIGVTKGDTQDWRSFQLDGRKGLVKIKLHWDDARADVNADLYDAFGANVVGSPGRQPQPQKQVLAMIEPGKYYVRVSQPANSVGTIYSMMVEW